MSKIIINGQPVDSATVINFLENPKRKNCNAYKRYAKYSSATSWAQYEQKNSGKYMLPDARHDHLHGFLKFVTDE